MPTQKIFKSLDELPSFGYLRLKQFIPAFGFSKATFYRGIARGILPTPIKWGRASLWRAEDIRNVLEHFEEIAAQLTK